VDDANAGEYRDFMTGVARRLYRLCISMSLLDIVVRSRVEDGKMCTRGCVFKCAILLGP
jgi:hypothetical protein